MTETAIQGKTVKQENDNALSALACKVYSGILTIWLLAVFSILPLIFNDRYYNIFRTKYIFYFTSVLALLSFFLIATVTFAIIDHRKYEGINRKRILNSLTLGRIWKRSTVVDRWMFIFWTFVVISTLQSDYLYESFWGNEGRYSGLFLITLYVLSTFLVIKFGRIKKWYLEVFLLVGVLVCAFGITDFFRMDIFHFKVNVSYADERAFISTIGNVNTYTAYVALLIGVGCGLFTTEKNYFRAFFHYITILLSFFAIITGQSDNAYLALGALFGLLPLQLFKTRKGIKRYALLIAGFFSIIKVIALISNAMGERIMGITGVFGILASLSKLSYIVIALWGLVIVLYIGDLLLFKNKEDKVGKWFCFCWSGVLMAAVIFIVYILYDANFGSNPEKYGALSSYLVFQDTWGTNRGYCWRIGWETYRELPLHHRLFGFGPDTFGILTFDFREEAVRNFEYYFESAHNEYLQYFVTIGPFGLVSYLAFLGSGCWSIIKRIGKCPWLIGPIIAVICYAAQAVVNINLPIATPIMWLLLAIGLAVCRHIGEEEEQAALVQSVSVENDSDIIEDTDIIPDKKDAKSDTADE